jgi:phage-related protein
VPEVRLVYYQERGHVPMVEWLATLDADARWRCEYGLDRLRSEGHALRRPLADYIARGIFELRVKHLRVHYRMLYFFCGRSVVVVSHGFAKQGRLIPYEEIRRAVDRKLRFEADPRTHGFSGRDES